MLLLAAVKHKWKLGSSQCSLADLQKVGVDVETDVGEVLLATESWDVTDYLLDENKQTNKQGEGTLILPVSMLFL